jgi:hypothetical protein
MKQFIEILLLVIVATVWALYDDRKGDKHPNKDWIGIGIIMVVSSIWVGLSEMSWLMMVKGLCVAYAGFLLFFPPMINFLLMRISFKNLHRIELDDIVYCFRHLSPTSVPDKWKWYRAIPWYVRILVYLLLFVLSIIWFV